MLYNLSLLVVYNWLKFRVTILSDPFPKQYKCVSVSYLLLTYSCEDSWIHTFPRLIETIEMQIASFKIWTQTAVFISIDNNCY